VTSRRDATDELRRRREKSLQQGGPAKVDAHHAKGHLTARERVDLLFDPGTFVEIGMFAHSDNPAVGEDAAADAVVTGVGNVNGRKAVVVAIDATVLGGSNGRIGLRKQGHMNYLAETKGVPLVVLGDASGGRMPDMLEDTFAEVNGLYEGEVIFGLRHRRVRIPRVTAIMGTAYGDPAFYAAASDFVTMTEDSSIGLSGPPVVAGAMGLRLSDQELGGPDVAAKQSGIAHRVVPDDPAAIRALRDYLGYLPVNDTQPAPHDPAWRPPEVAPETLADLVPEDFRRAYDVRAVIEAVVDHDSFFEIHKDYGRAVVSGLARIEGRSVVVVANQPLHRAGVADADALRKTCALVSIAEDFRLPIVFLQDLPGVMIGPDSEKAGMLREAIHLLRAVTTATVPRVTVVLRKAYGFGWVLYGGYPSGADYVVTWPDAQVYFMAPATGAIVVNKRRLDAVRTEEGEEAYRTLAAQLAEEMNRGSETWRPAGRAAIHSVIEPEATRQAVIDGIYVGESWVAEDRRDS
jgi:acetyl-CoA carboxylase carboxyltransferase component